jgi:endonuclease/exonuclease/phosphatase (EEP) superfamily protein YafD
MILRPWRLIPWVVVLAATVLLWSASLPLPGGRRLDTVTPFAQLLAARPLGVVVAVVLAVVGLVVARRRRRGALAPLALLLVAVGAGLEIAPRAVSSGEPPPSGGRPLTVASANVLLSRVRPAAIVALVRRTRADVVALPEANARTARSYARALTAARGEEWRTWSDRGHAADDPSAGPTSILVRAVLGPERLADPPAPDGAHGGVRVRLTRGAGGPAGTVVAAVHPRPPYPAATQAQWRADLLALRPLCASADVIAGDLNATVDHSPLRAVLGAGCRDAAGDTGQGLRATWRGGPLGWLRPTIDHVLAGRDGRATESGVLRVAGSDHRAVWARVATRAAG